MVEERVARNLAWYSRRVEAELGSHYCLTIPELPSDVQTFLLVKRREIFDDLRGLFLNQIWPNGLSDSTSERRDQLNERGYRISDEMLTLLRGILDAEEQAEIRRLDKKFEGQVDP